MGKYRPEIWNLRGMRRGEDNGLCPLNKEEENEIHIQLKCKAIQIKSNILKTVCYIKKNSTQENTYFFPLRNPVVFIYITR